MLFEPFAQADVSTTRKHGGTGLGLTISRELAGLMGGEIGAEPRQERGSLFWFTAELPAIVGPANQTARPGADLIGLRALIVDDSPTTRTILEHYLTALGLVCDIVAGPFVALDALDRAQREGRPYRLAILDYKITGTNGGDFARTIRERPALGTMAIVLLTTSLAEGQAAAQAGLAHCLLKPPRQSELYNTVAAAIGAQPLKPEGTPVARSARSAVHLGDGALVLVAEDNEVNQIVARAMLEKRGLRVHLARTGLDAVRMSAANDYAAIFMDCQMPELDGYEATARIRARDSERHTPIIATTANSMPGDGERCIAAGMDDYIQKPIQKEHLDRALGQWLMSRKNARESWAY